MRWVQKEGERIVIVFEGRDGAGKGGTISRFTQHLNPRHARIVALSKPSDTEMGQWYFQRYAAEMPTAGEVVFFDRSWYNRAGVEPVMGFCTPAQTEHFLREAPAFEGMLARDGIRLIKLFLTIGREMQMTRLHARWHDPLKRWKLSPMDFEAIPHFDDYSRAFDAMLGRTSTEDAPWFVVRSNDKLRARLNAIRHVLRAIPYKDKDETAIGALDDKDVRGIVEPLAAAIGAWHLAGLSNDSPRGLTSSALVERVEGVAVAGVHDAVALALAAAFDRAASADRVVAFGSFFVAAAALTFADARRLVAR